jgi:hypothetical protein
LIDCDSSGLNMDSRLLGDDSECWCRNGRHHLSDLAQWNSPQLQITG